jgi:SET domain-containing protein
MLVIPTELRSSPIHGFGVFLLAPVKKGELVWRFDSRIDRVYTKAEREGLPEHIQKLIEVYAPWHEATDMRVLYGDYARHLNHSDSPNLLSSGGPFGDDVAAFDLASGTELTVKYHGHF